MIMAKHQPAAEPNEVLERTVSFPVPLVPPTVNHYKVPAGVRPDRTTGKLRPTYKLTPQALAYKQAVCIFARQATITPDDERERKSVRYGLFVRVVLGKGQHGDGDNFWKCIADGLVDAGVIHTDARVYRWYLDVIDTDRQNPRTEITATVLSVEDWPDGGRVCYVRTGAGK